MGSKSLWGRERPSICSPFSLLFPIKPLQGSARRSSGGSRRLTKGGLDPSLLGESGLVRSRSDWGGVWRPRASSLCFRLVLRAATSTHTKTPVRPTAAVSVSDSIGLDSIAAIPFGPERLVITEGYRRINSWCEIACLLQGKEKVETIKTRPQGDEYTESNCHNPPFDRLPLVPFFRGKDRSIRVYGHLA